jgi:hypothetical protein
MNYTCNIDLQLYLRSSGVTGLFPLNSKYDKQDQQGKAAFNERNPHMTQQQEPMARSPGGSAENKQNRKNEVNFQLSLLIKEKLHL